MIIGLTGGIGSGKSYVAEAFRSMGAVIYDTDKAAKRLMVSEPELVAAIKLCFGEESYTASGELNRAYLASVVFSCGASREKLNALVHPAVRHDFRKFVNCNCEMGALVVLESAILIESGFLSEVDCSVAVSAYEDIRVKRCAVRDGVSEGEVRRRIAVQMSDSERNSMVDYVIYNNEEELILPQIVAILEKNSVLS